MKQFILLTVFFITGHLSISLAQYNDTSNEVFNQKILDSNRTQILPILEQKKNEFIAARTKCNKKYNEHVFGIILTEKSPSNKRLDCLDIKYLRKETLTIEISELKKSREGLAIIGAIISAGGMNDKLSCIDPTNCIIEFQLQNNITDIYIRVKSLIARQQGKNTYLANSAQVAIEKQLRNITPSTGGEERIKERKRDGSA